MRRLIATLILTLAALTLSAAVYPYDPDIGQVGEGSHLVLDAMKTAFSPEWMETYVEESFRRDFSTLHGSTLASILPLSNFIMTPLSGRQITLKERESGIIMTIFLSSEGLIQSLSLQGVQE